MKKKEKYADYSKVCKTCENLQTYTQRTKTHDVEEITSPGRMPIKTNLVCNHH
jgi:hypothetical protein